jgi:hypothetical protein
MMKAVGGANLASQSRAEQSMLLLVWSDTVKKDYEDNNKEQLLGADPNEQKELLQAIISNQLQIMKRLTVMEAQMTQLQGRQELMVADVSEVKEATITTPAKRAIQEPVTTESEKKLKTSNVNGTSDIMVSRGVPQVPSDKFDIATLSVNLHPRLSSHQQLGQPVRLCNLGFRKDSMRGNILWCLVFVDKYWTPDDQIILRNPTTSEMDLKTCSEAIQVRMMKTLSELEEKKQNVRNKPNVQGFARRVRTLHKNKAIDLGHLPTGLRSR